MDVTTSGTSRAQSLRARVKRSGYRSREVAELREALAALSERLDVLEQELAQERRLQRRVAELTDLVTRLLIPSHERDEQELQRRLERFAQGI